MKVGTFLRQLHLHSAGLQALQTKQMIKNIPATYINKTFILKREGLVVIFLL